MAKFTIYSSDGTVRQSGNPQFNGSYMGVDYLEFRNISSPTPINWERGDFVDYYRTGLRYKLYTTPLPNKVARRGEYGGSFEYSNVQFHAATKELEIAPFRDLAPIDNRIHFSTRPDVSTYEDVYGIARRIQECMNDLYPGRWRIEVVDTEDESLLALLKEVKEYSVSGGSCLDALSQIYDLWKNVGWVHTYDSAADVDVITIGRANVRDAENTSDVFAYGKGNGLTSIKKAAANEGEFATRLYVYGSDRNIPPRYYNSKEIVDKDSVDIRNLMIPLENWGRTDGLPDARKAFLQADAAIVAKYGLIPRTVYFDGNEREEIYPSIETLTEEEVRKAMISLGLEDSEYLPPASSHRIDEVYGSSIPDDNGITIDPTGTAILDKLPSTFLIEANSFGFDPMQQAALANEANAIVSMKSGMCAGREFPIVGSRWAYGTWFLELERTTDDSLNMVFPNKNYPIEKGDKFVMLNIAMPKYYVLLAEKRLQEAGQKLLNDYSRVSAFYEPSIDPIMITPNTKPLRIGMYMKVYDADIVDAANNTDHVLINTLSIDEASELPMYKVTLREEKRAARNFSAMEDMVEDAKEETKEEVKSVRQFTERRFRSAQETLAMLQSAFKNFSEGINPVTVQTMAMLVGDESLQFVFTDSKDSLVSVPCPFVWHNETRRMIVSASVLKHMTLGIDDVTINRRAEDYRSWVLHAESLPTLDDADPRYVYVNASDSDDSVEYVLSKAPIEMHAIEGRLHLLVGILNSEYDGSRDFVTLYGFTEVLPGQITTNAIRSSDGSCYFDLENNEIGGKIKFSADSEGQLDLGGQNMLRNSGFTGDYLSAQLADAVVLNAASQMYNPPLAYWTTSGTVNVVDLDGIAVSGKGVEIASGRISQETYNKAIYGEKYVVSFKAKANTDDSKISIRFGGVTSSIDATSSWNKHTVSFVANTPIAEFYVEVDGVATLCDLQLERGSIATAWGNSILDNSSDRAYYQSLKYLQTALKGSTIIDGGLVLTNTIQLGDNSNDDAFVEKAGANGIYANDDTPAFWAGGTMDEAIELVTRIRNGETDLSGLADFVVTHGGMAVLRNLQLFADNGSIGGLKVTNRGLAVETESEGTIEFTPIGLVAEQKDGSRVELGTCGSQAAVFVGKGGGWQCYPNEDVYRIAVQINAANGGHAIHSLGGMFAGLRPKIRQISSSATLDVLDHTVILSNTTGMALTLPIYPQTGQTYKLIHTTDAQVQLICGNNDFIIDASTANTEVKTFSERTTLTLTYFDNVWYAEFK